ncbi:MAG: ribosome small subunit-dependent GTPase A [Anaerovoracaceae bacterium]
MEGTIVKGIAGFYYVKADENVYQCKARGTFKNDGITPTVGDIVDFQLLPGSDGMVNKIFPRKNIFVRPPISNVDCFAVVLAAADPQPNLTIVDKFLVMAEKSQADVILCINKVDLAQREVLENIKKIYENIYPLVCISTVTREGIDELKGLMKEKKTALTGSSGVGKSTILNELYPHAKAQTGQVSKKTKRGKHTTRHVELFDIGQNALVFDTPGFSSFDILESKENELQFFYPEMKEYIGECKYHNCRHMKEPGCMITKKVAQGEIHKSRYDSYAAQILEIKEKNKF